MNQLFLGITELYTPFKKIEKPAIAVRNGRVAWVGAAENLPAEYSSWDKVDLGNHSVVPGLVDAHTHLIYAGNRYDEYLRRARGESYEAILESGGGIYSTVRATQAASEDELFDIAKVRALKFMAAGVSAIEIKSGYGLESLHELKMLRVIRRMQQELPLRIHPTLLAHVIPTGWNHKKYLEMFTDELIPEVKHRGLAEAVDVFCDQGAFTLAEARKILQAALAQGLKIKVHAEQIARTGAAKLAAELGALSADHLEQSTPEDWQALAASGTVGTILPGAAVILRKPFPNTRAMWDTGVKIAIASDHNPGSSPLYDLWLAMRLAISLGRLSVEEALIAATANAADALGQSDIGRLEPGAHADFLVVDTPQALLPLYQWGNTPLCSVYVGGQAVWPQ